MTTGRVLAFVAAALLTACNGDSAPAPVVSSLLPKPKSKAVAKPVKSGPSVEELTAGMVEAVSLAKSSVPVGMKFQLRERPAMGKPVEVVVALLPEEPADSATLRVFGSDGLQLAEAAMTHELPAIEAGQAYKEAFTLTPTAEGVQLLTFTVQLQHDESSESRSFSVPLIVGPAASPSPAPPAGPAPNTSKTPAKHPAS